MPTALMVKLEAARRRTFVAVALAACALLFAAVSWYDYGAQRSLVENQNQVTTAALSEHTQEVFETADLVIDRVADRIAGLDAAAIAQSADVQAFLAQLQHSHRQFEAIFVIGPDGMIASTSRVFPAPAANLADRDYFRRARDGLRTMDISAPLRTVLGGTMSFTITRARSDSDRFNGVIGLTVSPEYFNEVYEAAQNYPGHTAAALVRRDGLLLLRYAPQKAAVDRLSPGSGVMTAVARGQTEGRISGQSTIDGRYRVGAFRQIASLPILVLHSIDDEVFLRAWMIHSAVAGGIAVLLATLLLVTQASSVRQSEMRLAATQALAESNERQRRAELAMEQMQKMEALGRLTAGVAHDFNNLLTAIIGPMELLTKRINDPRQLRLLDTAKQAAERGARLTGRMLAFARKRDMPAELINPNHAIHGMGEMIARCIMPMVSVAYELDPEATPISADLIHFEVALLNLCSNARDAMPQGGTLTIRTELVTVKAETPGLPPGRYVRLSVSDTGIGMDQTTRVRALEPFFTTKKLGQGTGLGLSTVYGLAQAAGGTVGIASEPGVGTTVSILMPQRTGSPARTDTAAPSMQDKRQYRILLVDDDLEVRTSTSAILQDFGHVVVECGSPPAALEVLHGDTPFDLLVTDYAMPGMTGHDLGRGARAIRPGLPILFITGYAEEGVLSSWDGNNAAVLFKPFNSAELARAIQKASRGGMAQQGGVRAIAGG